MPSTRRSFRSARASIFRATGTCVAADTGGAITGERVDLGFPEKRGDPGWGSRFSRSTSSTDASPPSPLPSTACPLPICAGPRPRKSLGQHFLRDCGVLLDIADAVRARRAASSSRSAPGTGQLTAALLDRGHSVVALEIEERMVSAPRRRFAGKPRPAAHPGDARDLDLAEVVPAGRAVRGGRAIFPTSLRTRSFDASLKARASQRSCRHGPARGRPRDRRHGRATLAADASQCRSTPTAEHPVRRAARGLRPAAERLVVGRSPDRASISRWCRASGVDAFFTLVLEDVPQPAQADTQRPRPGRPG